MPSIVPRQFRLSEETVALMDRLGKHLGLLSRAEVVRFAITELAKRELIKPGVPPEPEPKKGPKRKSKKS